MSPLLEGMQASVVKLDNALATLTLDRVGHAKIQSSLTDFVQSVKPLLDKSDADVAALTKRNSELEAKVKELTDAPKAEAAVRDALGALERPAPRAK